LAARYPQTHESGKSSPRDLNDRSAMGCRLVHCDRMTTAWKVVAKNHTATNKITNLENGYWGIMALVSVRILQVAHLHHSRTTNLQPATFLREIGYFWWECYTQTPDAAAEAIAEG